MKGFLIKTVAFITLFITVYVFFVDKLSQGYVDEYYNKLTQKSGGLILGISTASEGLSPSIIENKLKAHGYDTPIINFALDGTQSRYGDVYFKSVKKKLEQSNSLKNGIFIIAVSPGSFAKQTGVNDEDIYNLDKKGVLGKIENLTSAPNYDYIINTYGMPLYNTLHTEAQWKHHISHSNGWNEIKIEIDSDTIADKDMEFWKSHTIRYYKRSIEKQTISDYRITGFIKILAYLKTKGDVFLVRIPADKEIMDIEQAFWPSFNTTFDSIAKSYNVPFFNYSKNYSNFKTYDGLHFESKSAIMFTKRVSEDINNALKNNKHTNALIAVTKN